MRTKNEFTKFWSKEIISVSVLGLVLFLFSSHEIFGAIQLQYTKKQGDNEVTLSHQPGVYDDSITLTIKLPGEGQITLITHDNTTTIEEQTVIFEPTVVKITYKDSLGNQRQFIGNYIVNQNHQLPIVALTVKESEFFPPDGIYDGYMYTDSTEELVTVGKSWQKKPIKAHAQFFLTTY